jgi:hypothetical protein
MNAAHHAFIHLTHELEKVMSAITDFAAKQNAHNIAVGLALDKIAAEIATLKGGGTITAADQAALDAVEASGAALEAKANTVATS